MNNLRAAVESLPEKFEAFVFTDSDARLAARLAWRNWWRLWRIRGIGATTAYRWLIPGANARAGNVLQAPLPPPGMPR